MSGYAFHADLQDSVGSVDVVLRDVFPDLVEICERARPLRFHVARDQYLIAYAPDEKPLWVVGIFHGRRNPRLMAAILRDRP
jgi:hypothetical protein